MPKEDTYQLTLTRKQLTHLRDLMTVRLPPTYRGTLSADLARLMRRANHEVKLWKSVHALCRKAELATDEDAPDFSLWQVGPPQLEVVQLGPDDIED